jgi:hypothetical protein
VKNEKEGISMTLDENFFNQMEENPGNYAAGVILPNGQYILTKDGHLHTLLHLTKMPESEVWEMIPKTDSPLFWLIDYTGCVITDDYSSVGEEMTEPQEETYRALVEHGVIQDKYYNISRERKRRAQECS